MTYEEIKSKLIVLIKKLLGIETAELKNLMDKQSNIPNPATSVQSYLWDNATNARHSVRMICDDEGLSVADKNVLCACVQVESGFNPRAVHYNKDENGKAWSADFGICQINDFFNIGEKRPFPSAEYVLNNPEACIRFMCTQWKRGESGKRLWASYTSGAYKQYL